MEIITQNTGTPQATKEPQNTPSLKAELAHFTGTSGWYRYSLFSALLTDGTLYLAEKAGAYWLMDLIASYRRKLQGEPFQVWDLKVSDHEGIVTCEDGNSNKLVEQKIKYTDFPLPEIKLYAVLDSGRTIILLPSEY
jgi:hypothetical protein